MLKVRKTSDSKARGTRPSRCAIRFFVDKDTFDKLNEVWPTFRRPSLKDPNKAVPFKNKQEMFEYIVLALIEGEKNPMLKAARHIFMHMLNPYYQKEI